MWIFKFLHGTVSASKEPVFEDSIDSVKDL